MKKTQEILDFLRERGHRNTPVRRSLVEALEGSSKPLAVSDLLEILAAQGIHANKTTLYRELSFLQAQGVATDVRFNERQVRYELADGHSEGHHHHVVCTSCDRVEDVELPGDLAAQEQKIEQLTSFTIQRHVLEFFGVCASCRS